MTIEITSEKIKDGGMFFTNDDQDIMSLTHEDWFGTMRFNLWLNGKTIRSPKTLRSAKSKALSLIEERNMRECNSEWEELLAE